MTVQRLGRVDMKRRRTMRRRKCPFFCPCICHDTGGSGHDHDGAPCPGKAPDFVPRFVAARSETQTP